MPRDYKVYLDDILDAISKIEIYVAGQDWATASRDPKTLDAVIRNLEVIGEAVKNLPSVLKNNTPGPEWRKIGGLRDILAHQYFGIDSAIIGDVVENKLSGLKEAARRILLEEEPEARENPATYKVLPKRPRTDGAHAHKTRPKKRK